MDAAAESFAEQEDREEGIDQQDIFYRVVLFLAARTRGLCRRVLGADDAPFGPVMGKRGESGTMVGAAFGGVCSSSSSATTVVTSASATPSRCARAVRERAGASPRV